MKFHGVQIQEGSSISNLTVASGTAFPGSPNEAEVFYRTDSDTRVRGLHAYIGGTWDRIASADSVTVPSAANFPALANTGDLFYRDSNDANEALYVYNGATWIPAASGSGSTATVTGDVTGTLLVGGSGALTLANITAGTTVGIAANSTIITYDSKGRITNSTTTPIAIAATQVTTGSFSDARIAQSNVTQHQGALSIAAGQTTSGTFADARIAASNVTQHQAALTILETQITNGSLLARLADNETITGAYQFNNPIVTATPISGSHATTKDYVDQAIAGLSWKNSALVATTANITLTGLQTVDGVALVVGNRVLVKNQSTQAENGVYAVAASVWTRAADFDAVSPLDEVNSAAVFVRSGTTQADTAWTQTAPVVTIGSDAMVFAQFAGSNTFITGAGLTMTGNSFDVNTASAARIVVNTDNIDLATVTNSGLGTFQKLTTDAYGRVTGTTAVVAGDITPLVNATYVAKAGDTMTGNLSVTAISGVAQVRMESTDTAGSGRVQVSANGTNSSQFAQYGTTSAGNFMSGVPLAGLTALFTAAVSTGFLISQQGAAPLILATSAIERLRIDSAGNVGISVIPGTWAAAAKAIEFTYPSFGQDANGAALMSFNARNTGIGTWVYKSLDEASLFLADTDGSFKWSNAVSGATGSTAPLVERMRITPTGDVGIGTASPAYRLHIARDTPASLGVFRDLDVVSVGSAGTFIDMGARNGSTFVAGAQIIGVLDNPATSGTLSFATRNSNTIAERMRITSTGDVGIGTALPTSKLDVVGAGDNGMQYRTSTRTVGIGQVASEASVYWGSSTALTFFSGIERMRIDAIGNVGISRAADAWGSGVKAVTLGAYGSFYDNQGGFVGLSANTFFNGTNWISRTANRSLSYEQEVASGSHVFYNAAAVGAGAPAPLIERMRIDNVGNVGIGTASPTSRLHIDSVNGASGLIVSQSPQTASQVNIGIGYVTSGRPFVGTNTNSNALEVGTRLAADVIFVTNSIERMRIDSIGDVSIGITVTSTFGHGGTNKVMQIHNAGTASNSQSHIILTSGITTLAGSSIGSISWALPGISSASAGRIGHIGVTTSPSHTTSTPAGDMAFCTKATGESTSINKMMIDSNGSVGIGVGIASVSSAPNPGISLIPGINSFLLIGHGVTAASGVSYAAWYHNSTLIGNISQSGTTAVQYNTTSDRRLKRDIIDAPSAGAMIDAIQVRSFNWNNADEPVTHGFIAQELVQVAPEAVKVGDAEAEIIDTWGVDPSKLVAMMIKEIQELRARVALLEAK